MSEKKSGVIFDPRPLESLIDDSYILKLLQNAGLSTIGDLQKSLIGDKYVYLIGQRRKQYLVELLESDGLTARHSWTDRLYRTLFANKVGLALLSIRGEELLVNKLLYWLYDQNRISHSEPSANPAFIFFGRLGIGRLKPTRPDTFDSYEGYEITSNSQGRYDDVVQSSGQLARITGIDPTEVNRIYQRCLRLLRSETYRTEIQKIFEDYAELRP